MLQSIQMLLSDCGRGNCRIISLFSLSFSPASFPPSFFFPFSMQAAISFRSFAWASVLTSIVLPNTFSISVDKNIMERESPPSPKKVLEVDSALVPSRFFKMIDNFFSVSVHSSSFSVLKLLSSHTGSGSRSLSTF